MARERIATAEVPSSDDTSGEQLDLIAKSPAEKELEKHAKKWLEIKEKRHDYLTDAKKNEDEAHKKMVESADSLKLSQFTISGRLITINNKRKAVSKNASIRKKKKKKKMAAA